MIEFITNVLKIKQKVSNWFILYLWNDIIIINNYVHLIIINYIYSCEKLIRCPFYKTKYMYV